MFVKSNILRSPHAFATRNGGISTEHTSSLNMAFGRGDSDETVIENLNIFANAVGFDPHDVISLPQIHSANVYKVDKSNCGEGYFKRDSIRSGDGYVTNCKNVVLGVKTADCVPILFEAEKNEKIIAVGAVHAGWRGSVAGIAPLCVERLCAEFDVNKADIRAAIGPSIHPCCYEVGEDLFWAVKDSLGDELAKKFVTKREGNAEKYSCDLQGLNRELLIRCGMIAENIDVIDLCTCCRPDMFFSHRYTCGKRGTMLNVIFIDNE